MRWSGQRAKLLDRSHSYDLLSKLDMNLGQSLCVVESPQFRSNVDALGNARTARSLYSAVASPYLRIFMGV